MHLSFTVLCYIIKTVQIINLVSVLKLSSDFWTSWILGKFISSYNEFQMSM